MYKKNKKKNIKWLSSSLEFAIIIFVSIAGVIWFIIHTLLTYH